jgi:hypothetical protein
MKASAMTTFAAVLLACALMAGPAGAQDKPAAAPQNSGFLPDYSKLAPNPDNPKVRRWVNKEFDFKPYTQILLDPVEIWVSPTSQYKGASPDALKRMGDSFTNSFKKALQPGYTLVDKPGPGVLHLKIAITGINLVAPATNPADFLPIVFVFRAASGAMTAKDVVLTGEMQALDPNNAVVAAAVATGTGDKTVEEKATITWKELQSISDKWAAALRSSLDVARGVAPKPAASK